MYHVSFIFFHLSFIIIYHPLFSYDGKIIISTLSSSHPNASSGVRQLRRESHGASQSRAFLGANAGPCWTAGATPQNYGTVWDNYGFTFSIFLIELKTMGHAPPSDQFIHTDCGNIVEFWMLETNFGRMGQSVDLPFPLIHWRNTPWLQV